jgi:biotin carboxylase
MIDKQRLVMSVGAGQEQIPTIIKAQEMGYSVLAVDGNRDAPGLSISDEGIVLDIQDEEAVVSLARNHEIAATLPVPIGRPLTTQGAINDSLGLHGVTRAAALNCTNKSMFHACLSKTSVALPKQTVYASLKELRKSDKSVWSFPVVLKPIDSSGSRGVMVASSADEWAVIQNKFDDTLYNQGALVQSFVDGRILGLDGAIQDGRAILSLIREKEMTPRPYRVELTHRAPAKLPAAAWESITNSLQTALVALGVEGSAFHADAIWTAENQLILIELSPRPAGVMITSKLVPQCTGIDFLAEAINLQLNGEGCFRATHYRHSLLHYWNHPSGVVKRLPAPHELYKIPNIVEAEIGLREGQFLQTPKSIADLISNGYLLLSADSRSQVEDAFRKAKTLLEITPNGIN